MRLILSRHLCHIDARCPFLSDLLHKTLAAEAPLSVRFAPHIRSLSQEDTNISAVLSFDHSSEWWSTPFGRNTTTKTCALVCTESRKIALVNVHTYEGAIYVGVLDPTPGITQGTPYAWRADMNGQIYFGMNVHDVFALAQARWQRINFQFAQGGRRVGSTSTFLGIDIRLTSDRKDGEEFVHPPELRTQAIIQTDQAYLRLGMNLDQEGSSLLRA